LWSSFYCLFSGNCVGVGGGGGGCGGGGSGHIIICF